MGLELGFMVKPPAIAGRWVVKNKAKGEIRDESKDFAMSNGIIY